jgi:EAL domain-containing protein (putative c-di-GMP-specific phosphodiesterase class I)
VRTVAVDRAQHGRVADRGERDRVPIPKKSEIRQRSAGDERVAELLATAKQSLGMSVAFMTRMDGTTQHLEVVDSSIPYLFREGTTQKQETTLCQAILDGKLPAVIPDLRKHPEAMALPSAKIPRIRSYVSVPVHLSDGTLYGTFCGASLSTDRDLNKRDKSLMDVLAHAAAMIIEPEVRERDRRSEIEGRIVPVMASGGPTIVLQPIVRLTDGVRIGSEALSRFPAEWGKAPDIIFGEAHSVGRGHVLELIALEGAARTLEKVSGYVSMNISPQTLLEPEAAAFFARLPLPRVLLELSEHDPVEDYEALAAILTPLRNRGMKLAIDDVGAGFSSLRHIVVTAPDVLKLDRSIVDGLSHDPVLRTLCRSLTEFAHGFGAKVVAEGIENAEDAAALLGCGVDSGQGWFFGRPVAPELLADIGPSARAEESATTATVTPLDQRYSGAA